MKLAEQLANAAPLALRGILDCINVGGECGIEEGLEYESAQFGLMFATEDMREGTTRVPRTPQAGVRRPLSAVALPRLRLRVAGRRRRASHRRRLARRRLDRAIDAGLLVLAGLFTRSLSNISREDLGIDVDSIVTFGITAQLSSYDQAELLVLYDRIEQTLAAQPGVRGVGTTAIPLFYDFSLGGNIAIEGIDPGPDADTYSARTAVGSGYFDALDVPLMKRAPVHG